MRTRTARFAGLAVVAVLVGACGADGGTDDGASVPSADEPPADEPVTDGTTDGRGPELETATTAAIADLAASEDVDADAIEVVTAEQVTWPDGALGCPEPDGMYTQALVPGYRIVLAIDGAEFAYHAAEGGEPARCDDPQPPVEADG